MKKMYLYVAFSVLWLAGCGSAVPFEKTQFATKALAPQAPPAVFVAEVPKGYQTLLESKNGSIPTRWDYVYSDSARLYVATVPDRILQRSDNGQALAGPGITSASADSTLLSGQDNAGLYWMERRVAGLRVGYRNVPHTRLYLFNYFVETFQEKR